MTRSDLKAQERQDDPANRKSRCAKNSNGRDWDREPDELSTHIEHRKGGHLADRTRKLAKMRETIRLAVKLSFDKAVISFRFSHPESSGRWLTLCKLST